LTIETISRGEFDAPGPNSPAGKLDSFRLPVQITADALRPSSLPFDQRSMQRLLQKILDHAGSPKMPIHDAVALNDVRARAQRLLQEVTQTAAEDHEEIRDLRRKTIEFLDQRLLPFLATNRRGIRRFERDSAVQMGKLRLSEKYDEITIAGARNRIRRAGINTPPKNLIGQTIKMLGGMVKIVAALSDQAIRRYRNSGSPNYAIALFRIGQEQADGSVLSASGVLLGCSNDSRASAKATRQILESSLKSLRSGKVYLDVARNHPEAVEALQSARLVRDDLEAPNRPSMLQQLHISGLDAGRYGDADIEYRLSVDILEGMGQLGIDPALATGHVYLFSELPYCGSCALTIEDFKQKCPNLDLIVVQSTRSLSPDEPAPEGVRSWFAEPGLHYELPKWLATKETKPTSSTAASAQTSSLEESDQSDPPLEMEQPWYFQLPPQTPVQYDAQAQGSRSTRTIIRLEALGPQTLTVVRTGGRMLFVAHNLMAALMGTMKNDVIKAKGFATEMLRAIMDDRGARANTGPSSTAVFDFENEAYDVTYSVHGDQIMTLTVDEHVEFDEAPFDLSFYDRQQ
jgi:hypothetical protein